MFAASALVLHILYPPQQARAKVKPRAALLAASVAVMIMMFALPHPVPLTGSFDGLYAIDPSLIVYTLVYATFFGGTVAELSVQFHRFARRTHGPMRGGLHVMAVAAAIAVAHNVATLVIVFRNAATGARTGAGGETGVCLSAFSDISCFIAIGSPAVAAVLAIAGFLLTYTNRHKRRPPAPPQPPPPRLPAVGPAVAAACRGLPRRRPPRHPHGHGRRRRSRRGAATAPKRAS